MITINEKQQQKYSSVRENLLFFTSYLDMNQTLLHSSEFI